MANRDTEDLRSITDPRERARASHARLGELQAESAAVSSIRAEAVTAIISQHGYTMRAIGDLLGVTRQRIQQILAEGPPPERALLAPDPGQLTICVIAKQEAERGGRAITETTVTARDKLAELAASWEIPAVTETVPLSGVINLNRPNLAVLIGPRSSALVAQALSADPVIKWLPDDDGNWYIVDTNTGCEYHSDFDQAARPAGNPSPLCYAHIGRVRRPDGKGGWLCLSGAHRPGVAGAAAYVCNETGALWEEAHKGLWSAVVRVTADQDGVPQHTRLVTPVYVHGRR